MDRLRRPPTVAPILWFASLPLYADELHDKGVVEAGVKVRVMADCALILCRVFLRLDGGSIAVRDARWFIDFEEGAGSRTLLLDVQERRGTVAEVRSAVAAARGAPVGAARGGKEDDDTPWAVTAEDAYAALPPTQVTTRGYRV